MAQPAAPDPAIFIARAAHYDVNVRRDSWGVPHVLGQDGRRDVAFGIGFAHSEDDFATIQDVALATRGTLAAANGPSGATTDYLVHLFRVWENVNARYEKDLPADVRRVAEAYADGVNYYAALHPDRVKGALLPLTEARMSSPDFRLQDAARSTASIPCYANSTPIQAASRYPKSARTASPSARAAPPTARRACW